MLHRYLYGAVFTLLVLLGSQVWMLSNDVESLQKDLNTANLSLTLKADALRLQSASIESSRVLYDEALEQIDMWKNLPKEVRFKNIYVKIPAEVNTTRSNCDDIKVLVNSYNGLSI